MKDPTATVCTARLRLRRFTAADLDLMYRLQGDPQVMRYAGGARTREQVAEMLDERVLRYYDEHPGLGTWATVLDDGTCVGLHLLNHIYGEVHIQVGYLLFPEHWGKGYATEMCRAVLRYGFAELGLRQITAITDLPNVASQRVLLKAGLHRKGERVLPHPRYADCGPLAWFERDAAEWLTTEHDRGWGLTTAPPPET